MSKYDGKSIYEIIDELELNNGDEVEMVIPYILSQVAKAVTATYGVTHDIYKHLDREQYRTQQCHVEISNKLDKISHYMEHQVTESRAIIAILTKISDKLHEPKEKGFWEKAFTKDLLPEKKPTTDVKTN